MKRILATVALAIVVGACGGTSAAAEPSATSKATTTPAAPTVTPTVRPTLTPEPDPTLEPLPETSGDSIEYMAFIERSLAFNEDVISIGDEVLEATGSYDMDGLATSAQKGRTNALKYRDWLGANPPRPCFAQVHKLSTKLATEQAKAYKDLGTFADTLSIKAANRGTEMLAQSTETLERVTAALDSVDCEV